MPLSSTDFSITRKFAEIIDIKQRDANISIGIKPYFSATSGAKIVAISPIKSLKPSAEAENSAGNKIELAT